MRFLIIFFTIVFQFQYLCALEFIGKFEQGAFILGKTNPDSKVIIDNKNVRVSKDGYFAFGLDWIFFFLLSAHCWACLSSLTVKKRMTLSSLRNSTSKVLIISPSPSN